MNIITISSPNKTVVVKRIGTIKESIGYIGGYLQALYENDINLNTISVDHKYINSNGTETNQSDWVDTNTKLVN